jgi:hypothetical protein
MNNDNRDTFLELFVIEAVKREVARVCLYVCGWDFHRRKAVKVAEIPNVNEPARSASTGRFA